MAGEAVSPQKLMDDISRLMSGKDTSGNKLNEQAAWTQVLRLREQLGACGVEAIPAIENRIASEKNSKARSVFVYSLGLIPGEAVDRILLRLFCFEYSVEDTAGAQLTWRTEHNGPFTFPVPDEQIAKMLAMVRDREVFGTENVLRILGMCARNDAAPIMQAILDRFIKEVKNPSELAPIGGSYISPRVYVLNIFLLAFSYMPEMALPYVCKAHEAAIQKKDPELIKWLAMVMGMCGDTSAGDYLKEIVLNDTDRYIRCAAIRPYERSAGKNAIPVLQQLLDDKTETEYHSEDMASKYFIAFTARGSLVMIAKKYKKLPEGSVSDVMLFKALDEVLKVP